MRCDAFAALALATLAAPATADNCPRIADLEFLDQHCASTDRGLVIAESAERADMLISLAEAGAADFEAMFGRPPAHYVIVERTEGGLSDSEREALKDAGYAAILPWLSPQGFRNQMTESVRRAFDASASMLDESQRDLAWQSALAQLESRVSDKAAEGRDRTAIPHELGHMWLIHAFWPNSLATPGGHYAGPGPDWLDELAAVLHEPENAAAQRRSHFGERYRAIRSAMARNETVTDELLDLSAYFTKAHPVGGNPQQLLAQTPGGPNIGGATIRVLTGPEAQRVAGDGIRFYLQSRLFADYILHRSGKPTIFGTIAAAMAEDPDFGAWLAAHGDRNGLPPAIDELEKDWLEWLGEIYPVEAS